MQAPERGLLDPGGKVTLSSGRSEPAVPVLLLRGGSTWAARMAVVGVWSLLIDCLDLEKRLKSESCGDVAGGKLRRDNNWDWCGVDLFSSYLFFGT